MLTTKLRYEAIHLLRFLGVMLCAVLRTWGRLRWAESALISATGGPKKIVVNCAKEQAYIYAHHNR